MTVYAPPRRTLSHRIFFAVCGAIFFVAAVVRIVPAFGDLWLDEIWTYYIARSASRAWAIFDAVHNSNNHHLNSLFFYWIGDREHTFVYRIPQLVAGIGSVFLACLLGRRHGRLEAILAAFLTGFCFALIYFSSEARGYPLAVFFALATTWLLDRAHDRPSPLVTVSVGACSVLGLLSHLTFLFFVAGAFACSVARLLERREPPARAAGRLAALYAPTLVAVAALTWIDLRLMRVGGGDPWDWTSLASRSLGYTLGLPVESEFALPALACAAIIGAGAGRLSWRAGDEEWLLVLVTAVVAPAVVLGIMRPSVVEVRYFLIGIVLYLLLASRLAGALLRAGGWRRALCALGLGLFAIGNAAHLGPFLRYGRGGYSEAVLFMAASSPSPAFTVGSNHDFRNGMVLSFYARLLPEGRSLLYTRYQAVPREGADWMVVQAARRPARILPRVKDRLGNQYRFAREFRSGGISGFWWGVYRNARAASTPARRATAPPESRT
jgi:hypothetical protein